MKPVYVTFHLRRDEKIKDQISSDEREVDVVIDSQALNWYLKNGFSVESVETEVDYPILIGS